MTVQGDSGSPFACQDQNGVWTVIGIASFVIDSCQESYDTRVPTFVNWIKQTIANNP